MVENTRTWTHSPEQSQLGVFSQSRLLFRVAQKEVAVLMKPCGSQLWTHISKSTQDGARKKKKKDWEHTMLRCPLKREYLRSGLHKQLESMIFMICQVSYALSKTNHRRWALITRSCSSQTSHSHTNSRTQQQKCLLFLSLNNMEQILSVLTEMPSLFASHEHEC